MQTYAKQFTTKYDKLYDLYNICYSDDSNDLFDALHDDILYQLEGYNLDLDEGAIITEGSVREITDLVKQIEKYYRAVTTVPKIEWIYG